MTLAWTAAQVLYLFAPLLVSAALSAVVQRWDLLPRLARPIDAGAMLGGRRLFGNGKTWRGVAVATCGSIVTVVLQKHVVGARAGSLAVLDYGHVNAVLLGLTIGVGAMLGELPNSFVKRRLDIASGGTARSPVLRILFWTWDQVDLLTTAWPLLALWMVPTLALVVTSFALTLVIHPLVAGVGYLLGARDSPR